MTTEIIHWLPYDEWDKWRKTTKPKKVETSEPCPHYSWQTVFFSLDFGQLTLTLKAQKDMKKV
jgi:hypothetical protein